MKNQQITVIFKDLNNLTITKSRASWIAELHKYCLAQCYESCAYNDNTLSDFLLHGFKGFENMSEKELKDEILYNLESEYDKVAI